MRRYMIALLMIIMTATFACSGNGPDAKLKEINALMSKKIPMTIEQREGIDSFIGKGKDLMNKGEKAEAVMAFDEALKIIKIAQDAAIYNAAE
ncbi:MAG: hypothetical protein JSV21_08010 [Nitrospirota bacterium]|nr:MAG: hypothetical protein JSV21_08010 [Nitrospirota bacterium]